MLTSIDETPLTRKQKLLLYSGGVCPRLTWPLLIQEFPTTWMDRQVDSLVTCYLKKWSGLGRSGNVALLYLPRSLGGQNLPCLSTLHKRLQVSRQCQFLTSQDSCVRFLADRGLQREQHLTRRKFRPAEVAREALSVSPGGSRKSLVRISKVLVSEEVNSALISDLQGLQRQGQMSRRTDRYNLRHDSILKTLASTIKQAIPPTSTLTADTNDSYSFPLHITATDLRPDLVWWDDSHRSLYMAELTVCFETNFEEAARRKSAKYDHLVEQAKDKGYSTELILLQVGFRGVPDLPGFEKLAKILNFHRKELTKLLEESSWLALVGSFSIWCSRNRRP